MSAESERLEAEEVSSTERPFIPDSLPVLPLRDTVLFPNSFMPLAVAREASVRLIDESMTGSRLIAVFTQRDATVEEPTETDLYEIGPQRLRALPFAVRCKDCEEAREVAAQRERVLSRRATGFGLDLSQ